MAIRNITYQHRDFWSRLDDIERLRLYAQLDVSKHQALDASLAKVEFKLKRLKQEAKVGGRRLNRRRKKGTRLNMRLRWLVWQL